jgi:uncharacterized protein
MFRRELSGRWNNKREIKFIMSDSNTKGPFAPEKPPRSIFDIRGRTSDYWDDLMNTPGQINDVAGGFAIGLLVSFTPLIGLHVALTFLITLWLRKSFGAAVLATLVFNPLTAPIFWAAELEVATLILGKPDFVLPDSLTFNLAGFKLLIFSFKSVFYSLFFGGMILGIPISYMNYVFVKRSLISYRKRIYERRKRRALEKKKRKKK